MHFDFTIFFSSSFSHTPMIESCNLDGSNRRTIMSSKTHNIHKVTGIAVKDRRLYYLDPNYEKVARVDATDGTQEIPLIENEPDLRTLNIFQKRCIVFSGCRRLEESRLV